eukprot:TRINITY_DN13667_c0_g1_i1.p1 TRINITY_DN13667_c0_g1~~TRINITY_DN13667_c0_g1_i1.p1  ORF type:complete len:128 (+),score=27.32 TRINITY_DN13667_c0_g1_i1:10-393(+)
MGSIFSSSQGSANSADEPSPVISLHTDATWRAHFDACKASNQLMVVDFSASWCGPCRFIEPFFKELALKFTDVSFVKIDVDELKEVAQTWEVQAMPTFVLFKQGKEIDKIVGAKKDELQKKIEQHRV